MYRDDAGRAIHVELPGNGGSGVKPALGSNISRVGISMGDTDLHCLPCATLMFKNTINNGKSRELASATLTSD
jgi:hypothetical protein